MLYILLIGRKTERLGLIMAILPLSPPNHSSLSPHPSIPPRPIFRSPFICYRHVHGRYEIILSISFTHCQSCLAPKFISPQLAQRVKHCMVGGRNPLSFVIGCAEVTLARVNLPPFTCYIKIWLSFLQTVFP